MPDQTWFTKVAGYRWTDVVEVDQVAHTPDGEVTIPMRMAYSGHAPRVEILQTVPGTVWIPADSGVHHLGYWSDDVESDLATLEANGMRYEVKSYNPDGSGTLLWAYFKGPTGPRIELVSRAMEPFIEYWWSTADSGSERA
jgi:lactoylglutathione lyase